MKVQFIFGVLSVMVIGNTLIPDTVNAKSKVMVSTGEKISVQVSSAVTNGNNTSSVRAEMLNNKYPENTGGTRPAPTQNDCMSCD